MSHDGTVGEDVAGLHALAGADDRLLVVAGRLVGALELVEVVDVRDLGALALGAHDDARRVDALDDAVALGDDADAGVTRELGLPCRCRRAARAYG